MQTEKILISGWQWQSCQGSTYLRCQLLEDWVHGFFTKQFFPQGPEQLATILAPQATVHQRQQVHGNQVVTTSDPETAADGLISEQSLESVWVASADCTPILIADKGTGRVAALHAGWRGTAAAIAPGAIARLLATGSRLSDLRVALGPAISGSVYQVSEEVATLTCQSLFPELDSRESATILDLARELPDSPLQPDSEPGKVRLDIRLVSWLQLGAMGLSPEQMAIAPYCTYQQSDQFFSYRRTQVKKVQWSGIVS